MTGHTPSYRPTQAVGNVAIDVLTCVRCFRPAAGFEIRDAHWPWDFNHPPGMYRVCECGHEWPVYTRSVGFDEGGHQ